MWQLFSMMGGKSRGFKILCGGEALPRSLADRLLGHNLRVESIRANGDNHLVNNGESDGR